MCFLHQCNTFLLHSRCRLLMLWLCFKIFKPFLLRVRHTGSLINIRHSSYTLYTLYRICLLFIYREKKILSKEKQCLVNLTPPIRACSFLHAQLIAENWIYILSCFFSNNLLDLYLNYFYFTYWNKFRIYFFYLVYSNLVQICFEYFTHFGLLNQN